VWQCAVTYFAKGNWLQNYERKGRVQLTAIWVQGLAENQMMSRRDSSGTSETSWPTHAKRTPQPLLPLTYPCGLSTYSLSSHTWFYRGVSKHLSRPKLLARYFNLNYAPFCISFFACFVRLFAVPLIPNKVFLFAVNQLTVERFPQWSFPLIFAHQPLCLTMPIISAKGVIAPATYLELHKF